MARITVINNQDELYRVINQRKSKGYLETELAVISESKLYLDGLHSSQISLMVTSGSFSDRMSRLLTGEDGEGTVPSHYGLIDNELEGYKQDILNDKMLVVVNSDRSSHDEVEDDNAAYKEVGITHYTAESEGPEA